MTGKEYINSIKYMVYLSQPESEWEAILEFEDIETARESAEGFKAVYHTELLKVKIQVEEEL